MKKKDNIGNDKILNKYNINIEYTPKKDMVKDKDMAIKIAEIYFYNQFGKVINDEKPFKANYDEKIKAWVVKGTLPKNTIGGVANIILKENDGSVVAI